MKELDGLRSCPGANGRVMTHASDGLPAIVPDLCVVVPAYNEESNLPVVALEVGAACREAGITCELLFVDDGSRDGTAAVIRRLAAEHAGVRGILLSRNFGHQAAVSTGLRHARGRAIAVMDADMQDAPMPSPNKRRSIVSHMQHPCGFAAAGMQSCSADQ